MSRRLRPGRLDGSGDIKRPPTKTVDNFWGVFFIIFLSSRRLESKFPGIRENEELIVIEAKVFHRHESSSEAAKSR